MLRQITPLNAIPRVENLKAVRKLNEWEKDLIDGKTVRQRSVRQETTVFKVGTTLPSNEHRTSDFPKDKDSAFTKTETINVK